jgi:hypothetical protein
MAEPAVGLNFCWVSDGCPGAPSRCTRPTCHTPRCDVVRTRLVGDENAVTRAYAGRLLKFAGCNVNTAAHGIAALGTWQTEPPDDVVIPDLIGFALIQRLRADEPTAARNQEPVIERGAAGGLPEKTG